MAFIYLVKNVVFIPRCLVKAVQDDISAKTVPIWLHHTVPTLPGNLNLSSKFKTSKVTTFGVRHLTTEEICYIRATTLETGAIEETKNIALSFQQQGNSSAAGEHK